MGSEAGTIDVTGSGLESISCLGKSFVRVEVPLVRSSCSSVGATTCTGSGDPPSAVPFCYTGSKLGETVNLKVNSFDSEAGSFDLTGSGLESISCLGKSFSKSGQDLVADLSDCVSLASFQNSSTALTKIRLSPPSKSVSFRRMLC